MADGRPVPDPPAWDAGWEAHSLAQRRRVGRLCLMEKLAWLEEAQRVVGQLRQGQPMAAPPSPDPAEDPPPPPGNDDATPG